MALRTMIIDSNFMMHRFARSYDFIKFPEDDATNYKISLAQHIACEIERVGKFVDNIVLVKDSRSWRKDTEQIVSINWETGEPIKATDYKMNRTGSEESVRNDELLYNSFNEFTDCLEKDFNVPVTQIFGAEGDDAIWAWTKYLREQNVFTCVYCSDSDIIQTVTPSNSIIRRVRSKIAQDGEIVIHPMLWEQMNAFKGDPFNYNPLKWQHEQFMIGQRNLESGLRIENPNWTKLQLMILGSGKDNVQEIFNWPSTNGTQTRHIGAKHIVSALEKVNVPINSITEKILYDDSFIKELYINIVNAAKPKNSNETITKIFESFESNSDSYMEKIKSNRKMGLLNTIEVPIEVQNNLFEKIKVQSKMLSDMKGMSSSQNICEALNVTRNKLFQNLGI